MIERLIVALRFFAEGAPPGSAEDGAVRRAAADFLDAYRLIVDCPQYELGATARAALADVETVAERLGSDASDARDAGDAGAIRRELAEARIAAGRALTALGTARG